MTISSCVTHFTLATLSLAPALFEQLRQTVKGVLFRSLNKRTMEAVNALSEEVKGEAAIIIWSKEHGLKRQSASGARVEPSKRMKVVEDKK